MEVGSPFGCVFTSNKQMGTDFRSDLGRFFHKETVDQAFQSFYSEA